MDLLPHPSSLCALRLRQAIGAGGDNRNVAPLAYLDDFHAPVAQQPPGPNSLRLFAPLTPHNVNVNAQAQLNGTLYTDNTTTHDLACNLLGSGRKRAREAQDDLGSRQQQQHHQQHRQQHQLMPTDFLHVQGTSAAMPPPAAPVSTGLRLAFEEATLKSAPAPSTSGRLDMPSILQSVVGDVLNSQHQQQRDEIEQCIKAQGEQLRQTLEEKRQRHSRSLIAAVEDGVSRRLRDKDLEVERFKRRNLELEEHVKQLSMEARLWQSKAKSNEAMLHTLRTNIQQGVHFSREDLSKEGCGDSEVDDAASSHHDDLADAQARAYRENRELKEQRSCRICRSNEVSILLLPCRHLCLCKDCEGRLDTCPVCGSLKNASVQVYMA
eukprot:TRINITY_DN3129_c0_g3_i1.p1 TRINITY_DN3129_c0_g3~~TRINITY_DN3129_c0_g3_i1.p1  ORF type:complete len:380 (+),score=47.40 TRINITY_DN3129_c0_g3_i1:77-1216(+)